MFARKDFRGPSNLTQDQSDPRSPHGNLGARGSCQTQQTGETLEYSPWPHQHPWEIYQSNPLPFVKIVRDTSFSKYFCIQGKCCFLYPKHLSIPNPGTTSTIMPMSLKVPMGPPSISLLPLHLAGVPCCRHLYATWIVLTALNFSATCKGATDPRSFMPIGCSGGVQS